MKKVKSRNAYQLRLMKTLRKGWVIKLLVLIPSPIKRIVRKFVLKRVPEPKISYNEFESLVLSIRNLPESKLTNIEFLEKEFIPSLGLNNESLHQQPRELSDYYGKGLHLWQYPNQLSKLLGNELRKSSYSTYIEIGSRWGGTFIVMSEFLLKFNPSLKKVIALDLINEPTTLKHYRRFLQTHGGPEFVYSSEGSAFLEARASDYSDLIVFVDGDHSLEGVMRDHSLALEVAKTIVHHDIASSAIPQINKFWNFLKASSSADWKFSEFIEQYPSVGANYLGIGVLTKSG